MSSISQGSDRQPPSVEPAEPRHAPPEAAQHAPPVEHRLTYQVILRHLAKFRDGARVLLDLFSEHAPSLSETSEPVAASGTEAGPTEAPEPEPKSPLELRIERHMGAVDRALIQINKLNPDHKKKAELPPEIREQMALKERTIHDIVGAELHFWAAAIENAPLDKFDPIEQAWIRRIIRLANLIGVDSDHKEYLDFLEDWASQEHA
jgi:hypothetical protein